MTITNFPFILVSGDANLDMDKTSLTVRGFTQPGVARALNDIPANTEKKLSQRFLWMFPKPMYRKFSSLGELPMDFMSKMSKCKRIQIYTHKTINFNGI